MSLADENAHLRKLARAVMSGELSRQDYQRARAEIIDRYLGDAGDATDAMSATLPEQPAIRGMRSAPRAVAGPLRDPPSDDGGMTAQTRYRRDIWIGVASVVAVLALVVAAWVLFR